jgi:hypothetical protein
VLLASRGLSIRRFVNGGVEKVPFGFKAIAAEIPTTPNLGGKGKATEGSFSVHVTTEGDIVVLIPLGIAPPLEVKLLYSPGGTENEVELSGFALVINEPQMQYQLSYGLFMPPPEQLQQGDGKIPASALRNPFVIAAKVAHASVPGAAAIFFGPPLLRKAYLHGHA